MSRVGNSAKIVKTVASQKGSQFLGLGEFACSPCVHATSPQVLWLSPKVQRHVN